MRLDRRSMTAVYDLGLPDSFPRRYHRRDREHVHFLILSSYRGPSAKHPPCGVTSVRRLTVGETPHVIRLRCRFRVRIPIRLCYKHTCRYTRVSGSVERALGEESGDGRQNERESTCKCIYEYCFFIHVFFFFYITITFRVPFLRNVHCACTFLRASYIVTLVATLAVYKTKCKKRCELRLCNYLEMKMADFRHILEPEYSENDLIFEQCDREEDIYIYFL